jgi:hypothetical protein
MPPNPLILLALLLMYTKLAVIVLGIPSLPFVLHRYVITELSAFAAVASACDPLGHCLSLYVY